MCFFFHVTKDILPLSLNAAPGLERVRLVVVTLTLRVALAEALSMLLVWENQDIIIILDTPTL